MDDTLWRPTATCDTIERRSEIVWRIRSFFHMHHFAEVHVPVISHDSVVDLNIDPIRIASHSFACPEAGVSDLYLQTSPEFAMKRLLAAGMGSIYSIGPVFRAGERGANHNPEFTMVEWYRVGDDFAAGISLLDQLLQVAIDSAAAETITYQNAFLQHAKIDPLSASVAELASLGAGLQLGVDFDWSDDHDTWLDLLFSELVQPKLGKSRPTIVTNYPATQSALARLSAEDSRTAERFELFVQGVELANGYHELLDASELVGRNEVTEKKRREAGKFPLPINSRLIEAMRSGIPACSGCALGLDRLLMVATQAKSIDEVITFPLERA
jgi:elongation factor P--(R)-beta-lysine ligase